MTMRWRPDEYRQWFETSLGEEAARVEKDLVLSLAGIRPGEQVLDVGCGDGIFTGPAAVIAGAAVGLDRSAEMLAAAARRHTDQSGIRWVHGDATALPFPNESFDVVLAVTVMCFAAAPERIVKEAARVLRPGGRLVIGELGRHSSWALVRRLRALRPGSPWSDARFFSRNELQRLLEGAGLRDVTAEGAVFFPPLAWRPALRLAPVWERAGRRWFPWGGALLAARGLR
jgi:ubiquinone/menaquinone biosynthesis C-methylase UbiE